MNRSIYVVSDLHLGGAPPVGESSGFQLCPPEARHRLARFVSSLADRAPGDGLERPATELVINGDFVDFLAEEPFEPFTRSEPQAIAKLRAIVEHCDGAAPGNRRVFGALRRFVQRGHRLVVMVGNHDIEMGLPGVRRCVHELLGAGPSLEMILDGEAYSGPGFVIEHGNRYDGWNAVSHGQLRAYRSQLTRGEKASFTAPPGSHLVVEVMNELKARYRFIDLLKPENEAVIPILIALEPDLVPELRRLAALLRRQRRLELEAGRVPEEMAMIGDAASTQGVEVLDDREPRALEAARVETNRVLTEGAAFAQRTRGGRVDAEQAEIAHGSAGAWLRSAYSMWRLKNDAGDDRLRHLRAVLVANRMGIESTFDIGSEHPRYLEAARRLSGDESRVVVFGHTHLAKHIRFEGGGAYINTGTWCPTIRLDASLHDPEVDEALVLERLREFCDDLMQNELRRWTTLQTVFARVDVTDGQAVGRLFQLGDGGETEEIIASGSDP